jgi:acylpyruvate hydrolase
MSKLVHFQLPEQTGNRLGVVANNVVMDITALVSTTNLADLLESGADWAALAKNDRAVSVPLEKIQYLPPLTRPGKIICLGLNYADHAAEGGNAKPDYPSFFLRTASSLIGHMANIERPKVSDKLDYEAELAVVIGKRARHLTEANALSVVAGYSCFNDATLRDYQRKTAQWTIGKNFHATGGFGPWLVTPDELPAGASGLRIESRLNGQVMQSDNTRNMLFPVSQTLCLLTEAMWLEPGDVIMMGTPAGVGYARKPSVWMKPGDAIEIDIEGIGTLRNTVVDEKA